MRKLVSFMQVSLDGFFADTSGDLSWAKAKQDAEFQAFVEQNARGGGVLLFGRMTYEMMASYWPSPVALKNDPVVAESMNSLPKIVFSRTLSKANWSNTTLIKGDLATEIPKLKKGDGEGMAILGSGSLVSQLAELGLIDEYQILVNPVALGRGRTIFAGIQKKLALTHTETRTFRNGSVFLCYEPV